MLKLHKIYLFVFFTLFFILIGFTSVTPTIFTNQEKRPRAINVKVGTTSAEVKAGKEVNLWAIIIGISSYKNGDKDLDGYQISNLKNAADDAQAIYDFLRSDEGGNFRDINEGGKMILLKDEQGTKANVEKALSILKDTKADDYFVVYIAVHGALIPQQIDKRTIDVPYFVLYDTDLRDMPNTGLKMEDFRNIVSKVSARKGLVLSDTCHSAGVQMAGRDPSSSSLRANVRYLEEMQRISSGIGFISASDQLEQSYELDELNHGAFTYSFLEALRGNADEDQNGVVTFNELVKYLREEVPRLTDQKQHPHYNTTSIEANYLPLSVVNYADTNSITNSDYGTLVIRTPDIDGVEVTVDGVAIGKISSNGEKTVKVQTGERFITFSKNELKQKISETVLAGHSKLIEVNLSFSQSDEEAIIQPTSRQLNVYLQEDKEPSKEAKELFLKGVEAFNRQKFDEALKLLNQAIKSNNGVYVDALVYRGRIEQSLKRYEAAVSSFASALSIRPSDFETGVLLAEAKFNASYNVNEIITELQKIIKNHPNFDYARVVLGDILLWRRDMTGAERQLRRAILINPLSPPAHLILADVLTYQNSVLKQKEAIKEAEIALSLFEEVSKKQVSALRGIKKLSISHIIFGGGRYINQSVIAEAHHILAKTINRFVERDEAITNQIELLTRARNHIEQAMKYAQATNDKHRLVLLYDLSAQNHLLKGDPTSAISDAEQALKLSESVVDLKDFPDAHYTLYSAYNSKQKFKKAAEHLEKFIQNYGNQLSHQERSNLEAELNKLKRAAAANRQ
ncbi:MAG: caspase family protein [Acidobacteria bacterium]|nr:caspase family protein [Acidobacteriota bacterium]